MSSMTKRFYPDELPPFQGEPLRDHFSIEHIDSKQNQGVISLKRIPPNSMVFGFTGFIVSEITQYTLQIEPALHLHDPYFMGKVLHACNPNTICDMQKRCFISTREIMPLEPITMDYASTEDILFKNFPCSCGASNCRKFIRGGKDVR